MPRFSLEVLLQDALLIEALHICAAAHELAVDEAPRNGPRARHLAQNRLDLVAVVPLVQLHDRGLDVDLPELLLGHAAVGTVGLAEDHHLVGVDGFPDELRMRAVHAHEGGGALQGGDHCTHGSTEGLDCLDPENFGNRGNSSLKIKSRRKKNRV